MWFERECGENVMHDIAEFNGIDIYKSVSKNSYSGTFMGE